MAFIREYVSAENVKQYELEAIWLKVKGRTPLDYFWTADLDRNIFFFSYKSGREEFSNQIDFVLSLDGVVHTIGLTKNNDRLDWLENITTTWHLRWFNYGGGKYNKEEVITVLKEALRAYKLGTIRPVEKHIAVFDF